CFRAAGIVETLESDATELAGDSCTAQLVVFSDQLGAVPIPAFGLVEVTQVWNVQVSVPEVERDGGFRRPISDLVEQAHRLQVGLDAARLLLLAQGIGEFENGSRKAVNIRAITIVGRGCECGRCLFAVPVDGFVEDLLHRRPVTLLLRAPGVVVAEHLPLVLTARERSAGSRVDGDLGQLIDKTHPRPHRPGQARTLTSRNRGPRGSLARHAVAGRGSRSYRLVAGGGAGLAACLSVAWPL